MYKIIKPRKDYPYYRKLEMRYFECRSCGCCFETDEWYETLLEYSVFDFGMIAICPECGAYLNRNENKKQTSMGGVMPVCNGFEFPLELQSPDNGAAEKENKKGEVVCNDAI